MKPQPPPSGPAPAEGLRPARELPRTHGNPPFSVVLLHGGPGALGDMAPVARVLAAHLGVLEPFGTARSVEGQIADLHRDVTSEASFPIVLAGHSWGAWLGLLFTARYPDLVRKLILIGCPPFEESFEDQVPATRASRLTVAEAAELERTLRALSDPANSDRDALLGRLGELTTKTDAFDPIPEPPPGDGPRRLPGELFRRVWSEAAAMRRSGRLLELAGGLRCPVVAIHGDYDPHPASGVVGPLRRLLSEVRLHVLARCGHTPWKERQARDEFLRLLVDET
ncbi:MAG: alpha/beta hydrolase [Candidatus Riflebacteria bacterium]|nr:alpha/beta hydrolase [Candidatus Riflebacteria bacterium]